MSGNDIESPVPVKFATGGGIIADISYDSLEISYPESHVEIFRYYLNGLTGTLQATVTATYDSSSKKNLVSLVRS